ncbi:hypothetical protein B0T09DRAFT_252455 [Sordaria sp. MPI-SDFR-AT-0083]|nr:hypothetical protein B0T09DRAFT_252455 [Sordaria sp. MPI-SDFR-AT-0083]
MKREDLNKWAVSHKNLPPQLYFVHHAQSQCQFLEELVEEAIKRKIPGIHQLNVMGGIAANCNDAIFDCIEDLTSVTQIYRRIKSHLEWSTSRPSCFVSTFVDFSAALRWGLQLEGPVKVFIIETRKLPPMPTVHVFRPFDFNAKWPKTEFLFLHQIPYCGLKKAVVLRDDSKAKREYLYRSSFAGKGCGMNEFRYHQWL